MINLYERIKTECANKGISIASLEKELNFPKSSICKWNKNTPSVLKVKLVADILGVGIGVLVEQSKIDNNLGEGNEGTPN